MQVVDFWYEFVSTYSYPAAVRLEGAAKAAGVAVRWRPFLLGPIFASQGWKDSPFNLYPVKGKYMWRDLERICAREGLPLAAAGATVPAERPEGRAHRARGRRGGVDAGVQPRRLHGQLRRATRHRRRRRARGAP